MGSIYRGGLKTKTGNKQEGASVKVEMKADHNFVIQGPFSFSLKPEGQPPPRKPAYYFSGRHRFPVPASNPQTLVITCGQDQRHNQGWAWKRGVQEIPEAGAPADFVVTQSKETQWVVRDDFTGFSFSWWTKQLWSPLKSFAVSFDWKVWIGYLLFVYPLLISTNNLRE